MVVYDHFADRSSGRIGVELDDLRVGQQRNVRVLERRADTDDFRVGFGVDEQGNPSQSGQRTHALNGIFCSLSIIPQSAWNG
jgi:hypothetical protein